MGVGRFVGSSLTLFYAVVDRIGFINNGCLFKAEYNDRSKKALAFFKTAIAEAIVLHSSF